MLPASEASRNGMAASTTRTLPMMSVSKPAFHAASSPDTASALTFGTTMSMPPNASAASRTHAPIPAASATSTAAPNALPPPAASCLVAAATSALPRAQIATWAPSAANRSAIARPMPFVAPVTSTLRPPSPKIHVPAAFPRAPAMCSLGKLLSSFYANAERETVRRFSRGPRPAPRRCGRWRSPPTCHPNACRRRGQRHGRRPDRRSWRTCG